MSTTLKCDVCGRFISYQDLEDGKAKHVMITPDSDVSYESFETLCGKCNPTRRTGRNKEGLK